MSVSGVACLFLLLQFALSAHGRCLATYISFPSFITIPGATDEGQYHSEMIRKHLSEGVGAVRSVSNLVLNVLDNEEVRVSPKNWVVSPLSLAAIFGQLLLGSRGYLQTVLSDSLSLDKNVKSHSKLEVHRELGKLVKYLQRPANETYILNVNSAVFIHPEVSLTVTYKHAIHDFYNADIINLDFCKKPKASTKRINDWVSESTNGKLREVYTHPLPPSTVSVMANAVYFNGKWENPFDSIYTKTRPFFVTPDREVNVEFMYGEKELLYKNTSDFQLVGIPYKNWDVVLYILLPHERLKTSLRMEDLEELISTAERENVSLSMPKLKVLSTISVRESVFKYLMKSNRLVTKSFLLNPSWQEESQNQGTGYPVSTDNVRLERSELVDKDIFDDGEGFDVSGASEDSRFKFNDVIHQVSLEVDEKGSEIAAVSSSLIDYSGDGFLLKINRPFWFFVRHEPSSTYLFWGRIVDPSESN